MNATLAQEGLAMVARPFELLRRLSAESGTTIAFESELARHVFAWFEARSKPGENRIGPLFVGMFFFDGRLWRIEIPVVFGQVSLDPFDSLKDMPASILATLKADATASVRYHDAWIDCLDYAFGFDAATETLNEPRLIGLLRSGDQELRSAVSQLLEVRPNPKAAMSCRMSTEMFLKAYAGKVASLTEEAARGLSHRLEEILDRIAEAEPHSEILRIRPDLCVFPPIDSRYSGRGISNGTMWECYAVAQYCGSALARNFANRDSRAQWRDI